MQEIRAINIIRNFGFKYGFKNIQKVGKPKMAIAVVMKSKVSGYLLIYKKS